MPIGKVFESLINVDRDILELTGIPDKGKKPAGEHKKSDHGGDHKPKADHGSAHAGGGHH